MSPLHKIKGSSDINQNMSPNKTLSNKPDYTIYPEQLPEEENFYVDNPSAINIFKASETKDLEKTKKILFELSDLVNTFSNKVFEQHQMTENSKIKINTISYKKFTNILGKYKRRKQGACKKSGVSERKRNHNWPHFYYFRLILNLL
jgi:hypothetical protein